MPLTMAIDERHRSVLGKRNHLDKVAMPVHCDILKPWVLAAVLELSAAGMVKCVGHFVPIEMPQLGVIYCDIYQLTEAGQRLCADHDIMRIP